MMSIEVQERKRGRGEHAMEGKAKETRQKRNCERNEKGRMEELGQQRKMSG